MLCRGMKSVLCCSFCRHVSPLAVPMSRHFSLVLFPPVLSTENKPRLLFATRLLAEFLPPRPSRLPRPPISSAQATNHTL
ncbi:hypothetical protein E2C01_039652 [Portunus trituberculatus]|uniref:Uncharacterized protein n=1 Tax=Portunus trituberculatus TaxID=210409 RepID=A0A5B7FKD1_PORTR|nr:hypothetical protein [Portunus trituberculatus]